MSPFKYTVWRAEIGWIKKVQAILTNTVATNGQLLLTKDLLSKTLLSVKIKQINIRTSKQILRKHIALSMNLIY